MISGHRRPFEQRDRRQVDLTEGTVKMHLHNSYVKTNVPNRTALVVLALAYRY